MSSWNLCKAIFSIGTIFVAVSMWCDSDIEWCLHLMNVAKSIAAWQDYQLCDLFQGRGYLMSSLAVRAYSNGLPVYFIDSNNQLVIVSRQTMKSAQQGSAYLNAHVFMSTPHNGARCKTRTDWPWRRIAYTLLSAVCNSTTLFHLQNVYSIYPLVMITPEGFVYQTPLPEAGKYHKLHSQLTVTIRKYCTYPLTIITRRLTNPMPHAPRPRTNPQQHQPYPIIVNNPPKSRSKHIVWLLLSNSPAHQTYNMSGCFFQRPYQ